MDFFTLQDKARKQTRVLVMLFMLAVITIVVTINLIFYLVAASQTTSPMPVESWLRLPWWIYISLGTVAIIAVSSLWRSWQLKAKPDAIAKMVNATKVPFSSKDKLERRLLNVVEEMSIASGTPVPKIYIMKQEPGINAFVAGLEPSDITLVVTQGLLENLNRQELQGVIAHEYSHVFHGDMRINIRLIGILAGILVIGQLGQLLARSSSRGSYRSRSKGASNSGGIVLIGLGLLLVGYIGLFFGRLIKAAISRQREFLADASAVQYTRDRDGIAGALYKIRQLQYGSRLNASKAEEMSHMCFGESVKQSFAGWLATHPPLDERIKAINPAFSRKLSRQKQSTPTQTQAPLNDQAMGFAPQTSSEPVKASSIMGAIGQVTPTQVSSAQKLIQSISPKLISHARGDKSPETSFDLIMLLLKANQNDTTSSGALPFYLLTQAEFRMLAKEISRLSFKAQHALLDLSLARIREMPLDKNKDFVAKLARLVAGEQKLSLTEFMIYASAVKRALQSNKKPRQINSYKKIASEIIALFNLLYQQSKLEDSDKQKRFKQRLQTFGISGADLNQQELQTEQLSKALNNISALNPMLKKALVQNCIEIVENDGEVNQTEYELLRLLGEYLDSPIPISV